MIPVLYSETERDYGHGGIGVLTDTMNYLVTEEANGEFELYLEYPVQGSMFTELKNNRLIKAKPNDLDDDHVFRIYEVVKDLERQTVYIYATSISNDLGTNMVSSLKIASKTAQEALNMLKANLIEPTHFNFVSDIATRSSTEWEFRNPLNCIVGEDGSLVKYWGGEVKRTNDTVYLYARRGRDNVAVLREGKNLEGLEMTISTKGIVTKILPYMIRYDDTTGEERLIVGNIVTSPLVDNYPVKSIKAVDYTLYDDVETAAELNTLSGGYFTYQNPGVDKPKVSIDIDIMQLADSPLYSQYSKLESLGLFDSVSVYIPRFDVSVIVKVNRIEYNGLLERAEKIQCGDPVGNIFDDVKAGYTNMITNTEAKITNIVQRAANGVSSIFRGTSEPTNGVKTGDLWYKPIGEFEIEMYQWNGMEWELILSTKELNMYRPLIESAIEAAEQAKLDAEQAYVDSVAEAERLIAAQTEAFDAEMTSQQNEIADAKEQADLAVSMANSNAEAIFGKLDLATYEANKTAVETELGKKLATATYTAQKQTQDALIASKVALTTYDAKMTSLDTAINGTSLRVDELEDGFALTATKTEVDSLKTRLNTAELNITATSNQLALKASQTDLNAATGRLTTAEGRITANANAIELRATKTDVNALTGRVTTAEGTITAQAGQIALMATTTTVNALTGRVSAAEASLSVQSGKIDLAATKTELTTAIGGIQVGGRNLLLDSKTLLTTRTNEVVSFLGREGVVKVSNPANAMYINPIEKLSSEVNNGDDYVLSVDFTYIGAKGPTPQFYIGKYQPVEGVIEEGKFNRIYIRSKRSARIHMHFTGFEEIYLHGWKLEKGNKATDWSPAPEDVYSSIATVQANLTVEAGKITALTARVSGSETNISNVTQTVSGINTTISTLRTDVNGKATIVSLNAVKSTADGNKTTISNHDGRLTTVETNVSGLQTTVSNKADTSTVTQLANSINSTVTNAIKDIDIGGRNYFTSNHDITQLVTNALFVSRPSDAPNGFQVTGNAAGNGAIRIPNVIHSTGWWTVSFDIKGSQSLAVGMTVDICDQGETRVYAKNTYSRVSVSVYVSQYSVDTYNFVDFGVIQHAYFWVNNIKVEKGNKATDWSAAFEDLATSSQLTQLSDQVNLRVTKGGLMSEINVQAGRTVISTGKLYLDTGSTIMTTAYINDLNAKTLTAITANIASIRSQVLVANAVTSTHINSDAALINKLFATDALIGTLTSKAAFINNVKAIDISADRITAGTLNAANVNVINVSVHNLVGNMTSFIQSAWNTIGSQINIDGNAINAWDSAGNIASMNSSGEFSSRASGADKSRGIFYKGRIWFYAQSGSAVLNIGSHPVVGEGVHRGVLATARAEKLVIGRYNDYLNSNPNAQVNPYISLEYTGTLGDESAAQVRIHRWLSMNGQHIKDVQDISGYELAVRATAGRLMLGVTNFNTLQVAAANTRSFGNFELQAGYSITNASDRRLKNSITDTNVDALHVIRQLIFVNYLWNNRPELGTQFGLIAQDSPFIGEQGDDGYWFINASKQAMVNGLAIQQIDSKVTRIDTYVTQHELEIAQLKKRIIQLEEKIA